MIFIFLSESTMKMPLAELYIYVVSYMNVQSFIKID